jgi:hypothetical protein
MNKFLKVIGSDSLVRDVSSGAIINNSSSDFENYQNQQLSAQKRKDQIAQQEIDINNIKTDLMDIKQILLSMIEQNSTKDNIKCQ